jgi:ABC-type glycerol-3-phosphate transport system substrate-binding protein
LPVLLDWRPIRDRRRRTGRSPAGWHASIPTVKDKATLEKYLAKLPPSRQGNQVFLDAMKIGRVQPVTPSIGWGDWGAVWNPERDKVMSGEITAKQFADVVAPKLNALIKEKAQK